MSAHRSAGKLESPTAPRASPDEIYQRLAAIALELERLSASTWLLEREREVLRTELRRQHAIADNQLSARSR